jgi:HPt (histidine-containing phosphotransfer) domain-containing protein
MTPATLPAQTSEPPTALTGFEVDLAVERMLGQPALWFEALQLFVRHFADWESKWQAAQGDDAAERRCVHALRSGSANVGASHLSTVAAALEERLALRCVGQSEAIPESARADLKECFNKSWRAAAAACQFSGAAAEEKQ